MDRLEMIFFGLGAVLTVVGLIVFWFLRRSFKKQAKLDAEKLRNALAKQGSDAAAAAVESVKAVVTSAAAGPTLEAAPVEQKRSLKDALSATEQNLWGRIKSRLAGDDIKKNLEIIEEVLYTSDLGPKTTQSLLDRIEQKLSRSQRADLSEVKKTLQDQFLEIFQSAHNQEPAGDVFSHLQLAAKPSVWMVVGVNGAGKTTSIGKLAANLASQGKRVLVAAGDTFRAAAGSQLQVWTERAQVEIFAPPGVTDPSAVAFDAVSKAKAQGYDLVIIDTAGRLHTQANLMEELKKMKRVMTKVIPEAPHETLIVLDANSGQNALMQAREFHAAVGLTGVILTKMDGTAKGGVAVGLASELQIPIRLIGVGEKLADLRAFSATEFVQSILP